MQLGFSVSSEDVSIGAYCTPDKQMNCVSIFGFATYQCAEKVKPFSAAAMMNSEIVIQLLPLEDGVVIVEKFVYNHFSTSKSKQERGEVNFLSSGEIMK